MSSAILLLCFPLCVQYFIVNQILISIFIKFYCRDGKVNDSLKLEDVT